MDIGDQLKQIRERKGLSLREVSERSGLSASFIGQVERNETSPSIRSMRNITNALGVKLTEVLDSLEMHQDDNLQIVTIDKRRKVENVFQKVDYYLLTPDENRALQGIILYAQPGASTGEDVVHTGEEFGYVISGSLWFWVDGNEYSLREGDSFSFNSASPHRWENRGTCISISLWVLTPPVL